MPEKHKFEFQGLFIHGEAWEMFRRDLINSNELILLTIVNGLVRIGGQDCWARNDFFAGMLKVTERQVSTYIAHLKELGVLKQTGFDGKNRYLRTIWSRTAADKYVEKTDEEGEESPEKIIGGSKYTSRQTGSVLPGSAARSTAVLEERDDTVPESRTFGRATEGDGSSSGDGISPTKKSKEPPAWKHPRWQKMADRLLATIQKVQKVNKNSRHWTWAREFYQLYHSDGRPKAEIKRALAWYDQFFPMRRQYDPQCFSAAAFRRKFPNILMAIERDVKAGLFEAPDVGAGDKDGIAPPKSTIVGHMSEEETKAFLKSGKRWDEAE